MHTLSARRRPLLWLSVFCLALGVSTAQAGLFDDDEARRLIKELGDQTKERLETLSKTQFDLVNQLQALREENARLRGQIETLTYELESSKKRGLDFYNDLDGRLRKLEPVAGGTPAAGAGAQAAAGATDPGKASAPTAAETHDYEAALNYFKANKLKEAASALEAFRVHYPDSTLAPNAQFWLGNAYYALRDCKKSMEAHKMVLSKWPQSPRASDAMLSVGTCQQELGDAKAAKATFEGLVAKYPGTSAAQAAQQKIKK